MNFLAGEKVLLESQPKGVVLTSHRVRSTTRGVDNREVISIMLEEVSSCAIIRTSQPLLLVLSAVIMIASFFASLDRRTGGSAIAIGSIVTSVLLVLYFSSRKQVIAISSSGATIKRSTKGMSSQSIEQFIDAVEAAKNARYMMKNDSVADIV